MPPRDNERHGNRNDQRTRNGGDGNADTASKELALVQRKEEQTPIKTIQCFNCQQIGLVLHSMFPKMPGVYSYYYSVASRKDSPKKMKKVTNSCPLHAFLHSSKLFERTSHRIVLSLSMMQTMHSRFTDLSSPLFTEGPPT